MYIDLNYGISKMKGDFFSWLSHDDILSNKSSSTYPVMEFFISLFNRLICINFSKILINEKINFIIKPRYKRII
jgi:hypothetical protein